MVWYVYRWNPNAKKMEKFNIFNHIKFKREVCELLRKRETPLVFNYELDRIVKYYFWGRCEYEVILTNWPPYIHDNELDYELKIDIYEQLSMNWDIFVHYIYNQRNFE